MEREPAGAKSRTNPWSPLESSHSRFFRPVNRSSRVAFFWKKREMKDFLLLVTQKYSLGLNSARLISTKHKYGQQPKLNKETFSSKIICNNSDYGYVFCLICAGLRKFLCSSKFSATNFKKQNLFFFFSNTAFSEFLYKNFKCWPFMKFGKF